MHCDDKRTIFVLTEKLREAKEEKIFLYQKIHTENNSSIRKEIETKLKELDKFISETQSQLSGM